MTDINRWLAIRLEYQETERREREAELRTSKTSSPRVTRVDRVEATRNLDDEPTAVEFDDEETQDVDDSVNDADLYGWETGL